MYSRLRIAVFGFAFTARRLREIEVGATISNLNVENLQGLKAVAGHYAFGKRKIRGLILMIVGAEAYVIFLQRAFGLERSQQGIGLYTFVMPVGSRNLCQAIHEFSARVLSAMIQVEVDIGIKFRQWPHASRDVLLRGERLCMKFGLCVS